MVRSLLLAIVLTACAGCASLQAQSEGRALDTTLVAYANAVRWGGWQQALAFVDPATLRKHPLSDLDKERYKRVGDERHENDEAGQCPSRRRTPSRRSLHRRSATRRCSHGTGASPHGSGLRPEPY